jgi:hypothetical protein
MADEKYTYATEFSDASSSLDKMRDSLKDVSSSTSDWVKNFTTLQGSLNDMTTAMSALTEKPLIGKDDVDNAEKLLNAMTRIKKMKEEGKKVEEKQVGLLKAMEVLSKSIFRNFKVTEGDLKKIARSWTNIRGTVAQVARSHTGIDLSLTGIVMALIDTYNLMRRIRGESMMIAGRMGGTTKAIGASKAAIGDLHKNFAMSYDDAAKIVHVLGKVGVSADRLAKGAKRQAAEFRVSKKLSQDLEESLSNLAAAESRVERVRSGTYKTRVHHAKAFMSAQKHEIDEKRKLLELDKKLAEEREKHRQLQDEIAKKDAKKATIASELYAIQVKYGIGVEGSANQLKNLMANYGKTDEKARSLYGTVLGTFDTLQGSGELPFDISVDELVGDWNKLIDYARVYKMDMLGILSVYQSMLRDSKLIGLEGVSAQVKKEITKTLVSAPLEMSYGWKARLAEGGGTPAQRALEFEQRATENPLYVLKRTVETMGEMLGGVTEGNKADQEVRGRLLLEQMGYGKESAIELTRAWIKKDLTGENVDKLLESQAEDLKKMRESEDAWKKRRGDLINYASQAAVAVTSTQDLIKRYVIDLLIPVVIAIRDFLARMADSKFFGGSGRLAAEQASKKSLEFVLESAGVGGAGSVGAEALMKNTRIKNLIMKSSEFGDIKEQAVTQAFKDTGMDRIREFLGGKLSLGDLITGSNVSREQKQAIRAAYADRLSAGVYSFQAEAIEATFESMGESQRRRFAVLFSRGDEQSRNKALMLLETAMAKYLRVENIRQPTVGNSTAVGPKKGSKRG